MPGVLSNPQHELFAQAVAKGAPLVKAYQDAGFKRSNRMSRYAKVLYFKPGVLERVKEITEQAAQNTGITVERILLELSYIGFANMADYLTVGDDGQPHLNWKDLKREQAAALLEVTVVDSVVKGEVVGRRTKFKLADKLSALVSLGKHFGLFGPDYSVNVQTTGPVGITNITPDAAALERILNGIVDARRAEPPQPLKIVSSDRVVDERPD